MRKPYEMCYRDNITDRGSRKVIVEHFSRLINKYGVPPRDKWILEKTPLDYEVHIPIPNFNEPNTVVKNVELVISYAPPEIANKICGFVVRSEHDTSKPMILQAPPRIK